MAPIPDVANQNRNSLVDLPFPPPSLMDADGVFITHTHRDHFDEAAIQLLPKTTPIFCQPQDTENIQNYGFTHVQPIAHSYTWNNISIYRTGGRHGTGEIAERHSFGQQIHIPGNGELICIE
jgi:L-ascorbate metabolism protein UlaG (beta-lactamase superfamily)